MAGRLVEERPETEIYTSFNEWKKAHPNCSPIANALIKATIKRDGYYVKSLLPTESEYTWGDYTEIKFWDSARGFAEAHAKLHPMRSVREHFVAELAEKMAPRFEQGYLIEVLGLRDKDGEDISEAMPDVECPKSVYHAEMERREEGGGLTRELSNFLKREEASREIRASSPHPYAIASAIAG